MTAGDLEKGMDGCVEGVASLYFFTVPFCSLLRLGRASEERCVGYQTPEVVALHIYRFP